jgi:hypothetical protein
MTLEPLPPKKERSVWVYVGIGCAGVMLLGCLVMSAISYYAAKKFQKLAQGLDPAEREANAKAMLGGLPAGYYAHLSLEVPLIFSTAMFGDQPMQADGGVPEFDRGFIYFRVIENEQCKDLKKYFEGKDDSDEALRQCNINVSSDQVITRGMFSNEGRNILYVGVKGSVQTQGRQNEGLQTVMFFECPQDAKIRVGIWFQKYDGPVPTETTIPAGSVLDKKALEDFTKPLNPCGR